MPRPAPLYLGYRNFDADIRCTGAVGAGRWARTECAQVPHNLGTPSKSLPTEQIHAIIGGAVVRF